MKLHNLERADNSEVSKWIDDSIKLTPYQKEKIRDDEIIRFAPFGFYKKRKKITNFWIRLSVLIMPVVYIILMLLLPINFLITARWGFQYKTMSWYDRWRHAAGL